MNGCCLLKYPLLGQIHIFLNMEILGCMHGKAWNPGLAVIGGGWFFFLTWTCTQRMRVSLNFTSFIFFTGLILLFYQVFYGFLAALFTFTMWAMLQTLNDEVPKYRDQISSPGNYVTLIKAFISSS